MRRIKKAAAPIVVLALVAAACGGDDDAADEPAETPAPDDDAPEPEPEPDDDAPEPDPDDDAPEPTDPPDDAPDVDPADILTDIGVTDDVIRVGLNADLSGLFAPLVIQIVDAQEVYFEILNDEGGIAGRQIELVILDNEYDVPRHLENYERMAGTGDEGVVIFSQSTGSPHTAATLDMLVQDELAAVALSWYSGLDDPSLAANVIKSQTNYCFEAMNGVEFLTEENDAQTLAIISFPGEYGEDGAVGAEIAAAELGLEVVYDGRGAVVPGADQTPVVTSLVEANPDIVWATLNPTTFAEVFGAAVAQGLEAQWSGSAPTFNFQLLGTDLGPAAEQFFTFSTYTALWDVDDTPGMREVVEGMRSKRPEAPVSDVYIRGWIEAMTAHQILEQAARNGDMTRAGVVEAARQIEVDYKGLSPNQVFAGEPNERAVRESYLYSIDLDLFTPQLTVSDEGAGTGFVLERGPYVGSVAENFQFDEACFIAG